MRHASGSRHFARNIRCTEMNLSNQDIDKAINNIRDFFKNANVPHKDVIKICLIVEEALLRWQDRFGEAHEFKLYKKKWFGTPKIIIRIKGKPFSPLQNDLDDDTILSNEVMKNLLHYDEAKTIYRYENGYNELISVSTKERKPLGIPGGSITVSIILAVIFSFLVDFLPQDIQATLLNEVITPILDTLMQLVVTVTIFMVFFAVISSICAIEDSTMLGNIGLTVIGRIFFLNIIIILLTIFIGSLFFPLNFVENGDSFAISKVVELFLSIIPTNILAAFLDGNILQVTVLAFLIGICITLIGNQIPNVKSIVMELNELIFKVTEMILGVIPLTIFLCIFKTLVESDFSEFFVVWKLVAASIITYAAIILLMLICIKSKIKLGIKDFFKKIFPAFIIAFTTVNSSAALPKIIEVSRDNLRIEEKFCNFWAPLAFVMFSPSELIALTICVIYGISAAGSSLSLIDPLIIIFLAIQLSIATPDAAGGIAAAYGIILTQFGLPLEIIGALMITDVVIDNLFTGLDVVAHECELVLVANKMGFIKEF